MLPLYYVIFVFIKVFIIFKMNCLSYLNYIILVITIIFYLAILWCNIFKTFYFYQKHFIIVHLFDIKQVLHEWYL